MFENLVIRPIEPKDLHRLWELSFKEEAPEWKKWDAPYYPHRAMDYEKFLPMGEKWVGQDHMWVVEMEGNLIGIVTYYWEHKPSLWLEMGIILYSGNQWEKGIGTEVMRRWMNRLFTTMPLARVGYTTWSGNKRMIRIGEKLGMQMEARILKVRYYDGKYYDSIRMGMLREEWEDFFDSK